MGVSTIPDLSEDAIEVQSDEVGASQTEPDTSFDDNDRDLEAELDELFKQQPASFDEVADLSPVTNVTGEGEDIQMDMS